MPTEYYTVGTVYNYTLQCVTLHLRISHNYTVSKVLVHVQGLLMAHTRLLAIAILMQAQYVVKPPQDIATSNINTNKKIQ